MARIESPHAVRAEHGWQEFLQQQAHGARRMALADPQMLHRIASPPPEAPWLQPPLFSLAWVETILSGLLDQGFTEDAAAAAYRAYANFLLGHLLVEAAATQARAVSSREQAADPPLEDFPAVRRLHPRLSEDHSATEFEEALEELLDRLTLIRNEHLDA